mmetsp:Transcript_327/g.341  ORF Transcript_327/g.341 Transcript_327/m.341 type:complete len:1281 (-) Transcript_327:1458-5300(-)|eukprot:CAMPEP_0197847314 /NCGR_PEP_ID=MMETSP1438-20131217/5706_1 /TAXON_ID=1461541 /ORGANISM="Pterosperma sp., Strain CCMP1384" /LENGTH=1280 /DNA_ID=CAMNT_0043459193 /DNA_START=415 /DNA_END=4257 /DNA_ORIENTATION=+
METSEDKPQLEEEEPKRPMKYVDVVSRQVLDEETALSLYTEYMPGAPKKLRYRCDLPHRMPGMCGIYGLVNLKYRAARTTHHTRDCQRHGSRAGFNTPCAYKRLPKCQPVSDQRRGREGKALGAGHSSAQLSPRDDSGGEGHDFWTDSASDSTKGSNSSGSGSSPSLTPPMRYGSPVGKRSDSEDDDLVGLQKNTATLEQTVKTNQGEKIRQSFSRPSLGLSEQPVPRSSGGGETASTSDISQNNISGSSSYKTADGSEKQDGTRDDGDSGPRSSIPSSADTHSVQGSLHSVNLDCLDLNAESPGPSRRNIKVEAPLSLPPDAPAPVRSQQSPNPATAAAGVTATDMIPISALQQLLTKGPDEVYQVLCNAVKAAGGSDAERSATPRSTQSGQQQQQQQQFNARTAAPAQAPLGGALTAQQEALLQEILQEVTSSGVDFNQRNTDTTEASNKNKTHPFSGVEGAASTLRGSRYEFGAAAELSSSSNCDQQRRPSLELPPEKRARCSEAPSAILNATPVAHLQQNNQEQNAENALSALRGKLVQQQGAQQMDQKPKVMAMECEAEEPDYPVTDEKHWEGAIFYSLSDALHAALLTLPNFQGTLKEIYAVFLRICPTRIVTTYEKTAMIPVNDSPNDPVLSPLETKIYITQTHNWRANIRTTFTRHKTRFERVPNTYGTYRLSAASSKLVPPVISRNMPTTRQMKVKSAPEPAMTLDESLGLAESSNAPSSASQSARSQSSIGQQQQLQREAQLLGVSNDLIRDSVALDLVKAAGLRMPMGSGGNTSMQQSFHSGMPDVGIPGKMVDEALLDALRLLEDQYSAPPDSAPEIVPKSEGWLKNEWPADHGASAGMLDLAMGPGMGMGVTPQQQASAPQVCAPTSFPIPAQLPPSVAAAAAASQAPAAGTNNMNNNEPALANFLDSLISEDPQTLAQNKDNMTTSMLIRGGLIHLATGTMHAGANALFLSGLFNEDESMPDMDLGLRHRRHLSSLEQLKIFDLDFRRIFSIVGTMFGLMFGIFIMTLCDKREKAKGSQHRNVFTRSKMLPLQSMVQVATDRVATSFSIERVLLAYTAFTISIMVWLFYIAYMDPVSITRIGKLPLQGRAGVPGCFLFVMSASTLSMYKANSLLQRCISRNLSVCALLMGPFMAAFRIMCLKGTAWISNPFLRGGVPNTAVLFFALYDQSPHHLRPMLVPMSISSALVVLYMSYSHAGCYGDDYGLYYEVGIDMLYFIAFPLIAYKWKSRAQTLKATTAQVASNELDSMVVKSEVPAAPMATTVTM